MCYRPIKLFSNTNSLRAIDSTKFMAPCGECEECRTIRACEYTFRIYNEMEYRSQQDYNLFFGTLTYNDAHLPFSAITDKFNKSVRIECFRRSDIDDFFKKLRKFFQNKYGITGLSYCCASEYGSHTQRSHYHFYLGVPKYGVLQTKDKNNKFDKGYEVGDLVEMTSELVHAKVVELWNNGFVFPRYSSGGVDHNGYEHKSFEIDKCNIKAAAFYIAKYCCKDLTFYGLPSVNVYKEICNNFIHSKLADEVKLEYKRKLREHMTFVKTSTHFGEHINDLVKSVDDLINGVSTTMNDKKLVPVPSYNKRKLIYHVRTVKEDPSIKVFDKFVTKYKEHDCPYSDWFRTLCWSWDHYLDPIINQKKAVYKYKVRYDLTSFGKAYMKGFIKSRIDSTVDSLKEFVHDTSTKEFKDWYIKTYSTYDYNFDGSKELLIPANFAGFINKLHSLFSNEKNYLVFSTYINIYCNRCSPLHLQFYLNNKDFFNYGENKVVHTKVFDENQDSVLILDTKYDYVVKGQKFKILNSISKNKKLNWTNSNTFRFLGNESLEDMVSKSLDFYNSNLNFDRYIYENKVNTKDIALQKFVHFNSFPCFSGFDDILSVFKKYKFYKNESIYETRAKRNFMLNHYKQAISEVEY